MKILKYAIKILIFNIVLTASAQQIIYVPVDYATIKEAHDAIPNPLIENIEIRLINTGTSIPLVPFGTNSFTWSRTGTMAYSIKIISDDFNNPASINKLFQGHLVIDNVNNLHFYNLYFQNFAQGLKMVSVKNSSIKYCYFKGTHNGNPLPVSISPGTGLIHISGVVANESENNTFKYNYIDGIYTTSANDSVYNRWHSIYISEYSKNNIIAGNTILTPQKSGSDIQFNHGFQEDNKIISNCLNKNYDTSLPTVTSMQCIILGGTAYPNTVKDNIISNNYTFSNLEIQRNGTAGDNNNIVIGDTILRDLNTVNNNHFDLQKKVYDSYWLNYETSKVNDRIISGDFNKDGKLDDLVIFKKDGNSRTSIDVLLKREDNSFSFLSNILEGYLSNQITSRIVSGDFDNDGYHNDIAVFYDYGNSETRVHIFKFDGTNFTYSGPSGWWNSSGYIANQITGRIVSGDFDNDGYHDDIAAFYDFGNSTTKIHMFKSNGSSLTYSGSSGWWNSSGYIANQITGKIVSGDFDNDGYHDDIAAFYDFGNSITKIHMFKSNSFNFGYSGSSGWWSSIGYDSNNIVGRLVAGDFNGNGKIDGFTSLYGYGTKKSRTHVWNKISGINSFNYVNNSLGFPWVLNYDTSLNRIIYNSLEVLNIFSVDKELDFDLYPNPSKLFLNIKSKELIEKVLIYNIEGEIIKIIDNKNIFLKKIMVNVSGFKSGIFYVKVNTRKGVCTKKIIIE